MQNDIKRVLAYSTVSQLGYMFLAMGVGAFGAGIFHLYTHAFFKACLFLGSGAVIHALHGEQDIRHMGGLKKAPADHLLDVPGRLAGDRRRAAAWPGFFSKDEILFETFAHGHTVAVGDRRADLAAHRHLHVPAGVPDLPRRARGRRRPAHAHAPSPRRLRRDGQRPWARARGHGGHLHDAPPAMALALIVLAIGSVLAGYVGVPHALGGHNALGEWLHPAFTATVAGAGRVQRAGGAARRAGRA